MIHFDATDNIHCEHCCYAAAGCNMCSAHILMVADIRRKNIGVIFFFP